MKKLLPSLLFYLIAIQSLFAETSFLGYVRSSAFIQENENSELSLDELFAARQNWRWYPSEKVMAGFELKQQLILGKKANVWGGALAAFNGGGNYFDWRITRQPDSDKLLAIEIDRLWLELSQHDLQVTLGRQRIAWGTNLVWNPIDFFNPSSPLDFDNEEKPGGDAVRIQYFTGDVSKVEAVIEARDDEPSIYAGLIKLNFLNYDYYFTLGHRPDTPLAGFAWAGDISGGGFRGETLLAFPGSNSESGDEAAITTAVSVDYTFPNTLYLHTEAIYNSAGAAGLAGGEALETAANQGWLTPARWSLFGEASYGISALLHAGLALIYNPGDHSWYLTPSTSYSLSTNIDVGGILFITGGNDSTEFGSATRMALIRFKWSF